MVKQGQTVWYEHVEAVHTQKTRPAVILRILRIIGDTALLVIGQTRQPNHGVCVQGKHHRPTQPAQLPNDKTYFDCEHVIATPLARIKGPLGRMPLKYFAEIERACAASLQRQVARVTEEAEPQRRMLIDRLNRHAEATRCDIMSIADNSRIARAHFRAILSGQTWWTTQELERIAAVLEVAPAQLFEREPETRALLAHRRANGQARRCEGVHCAMAGRAWQTTGPAGLTP